jgi:hypothetical protein
MALVLWSCAGDGSCDSAACSGTPRWTGTARLDDFGWGCEGSSWWYDVYTVGLTGSATIDVRLDDATAEKHPLAERASDPYGHWDEWYVELAVVPKTYSPGRKTGFACADEKDLTFKVSVTDTDGSPLPCNAYGADPSLFSECEAAK